MENSTLYILAYDGAFPGFQSRPSCHSVYPSNCNFDRYFLLSQNRAFEFAKSFVSTSKWAFMASYLAKLVARSSWNKFTNCANCCWTWTLITPSSHINLLWSLVMDLVMGHCKTKSESMWNKWGVWEEVLFMRPTVLVREERTSELKYSKSRAIFCMHFIKFK